MCNWFSRESTDANSNITQMLELSDTNLKACIIMLFHVMKENAFEIKGKKKNYEPPRLYPAKLFFRNENKIKRFSEERKIRAFPRDQI